MSFSESRSNRKYVYFTMHHMTSKLNKQKCLILQIHTPTITEYYITIRTCDVWLGGVVINYAVIVMYKFFTFIFSSDPLLSAHTRERDDDIIITSLIENVTLHLLYCVGGLSTGKIITF